jgi:hypothetical protein
MTISKQNKPIYTVSTWHDHVIRGSRFQRTGDTIKYNRSVKLAKDKLSNKGMK